MVKPKPGYKLVESLFGKYEEIPEEWEIKNTSSIMNITMGQSPPSESYNEDQKGLPFYQGVTDFGTMYPNPTVWCTDSRKIAEENSILFSVRAPVGEINLTKTKCCLGRGVAALNPLGNDLWYCYYLVNQNKNKFLVFSQGTTYDAINQGEIAKTRLPYTKNIQEQQKISSILSSVDELINNYDKVIDSTKLLKQGLMQILLTKGIGHKKFKKVKWYFGKEIEIPEEWNIKRIDELGQIVTGSTPSTLIPEYYGDEFLWASPTDLGNNKYVENTNSKLSVQGIELSRKIPKNSILIVCIGSTIGKIGIASREMYTNQQINSIICDVMNPEFVYYQLLRNNEQIKNFANHVAVPIINKFDFGMIKIMVPQEMEEQQKIIDVLSNVDSKINELDTKKDKLAKLKKGLMQKLLTGQIRVKN